MIEFLLQHYGLTMLALTAGTLLVSLVRLFRMGGKPIHETPHLDPNVRSHLGKDTAGKAVNRFHSRQIEPLNQERQQQLEPYYKLQDPDLMAQARPAAMLPQQDLQFEQTPSPTITPTPTLSHAKLASMATAVCDPQVLETMERAFVRDEAKKQPVRSVKVETEAEALARLQEWDQVMARIRTAAKEGK